MNFCFNLIKSLSELHPKRQSVHLFIQLSLCSSSTFDAIGDKSLHANSGLNFYDRLSDRKWHFILMNHQISHAVYMYEQVPQLFCKAEWNTWKLFREEEQPLHRFLHLQIASWFGTLRFSRHLQNVRNKRMWIQCHFKQDGNLPMYEKCMKVCQFIFALMFVSMSSKHNRYVHFTYYVEWKH